MLNEKQIRFCEEYLKDLNGTQAAIRAGYSKQTANEQASRMLANVNIQKKVAELMAERKARVQIEADEVLKEFISIAKEDISNFLTWYTDKKGRIRIKANNSKEIDTRNVQEVSLGKDGQFKFKLYSRENALIQIGRHLGMFTDRIEHGSEDFDLTLNL